LKFLRRILDFLGSRNGIRLVSLVAAVFVWYAIRAAISNSTIITGIPLTIQPPPDWTVVDRSVRTIDVAFLGTRDDLRYLNREQIKATIDARHRTDSQPFTIALQPSHINAPGSARIDFIRPASVTIRLDREITQQVPVQVDTQNLLPDGYEIESVTVSPATVEITGPERLLANLATVRTIPIDLDGRIRSINRRRVALVIDDAASGVSIEPTTVTLDLIIVERSITSSYEDLPIRPLVSPGRSLRAELEPDLASLSVKGRPEIMKSLVADDIHLFVDASGIISTRAARLPVRAVLPPGVALVRIEPETTSVRLRE